MKTKRERYKLRKKVMKGVKNVGEEQRKKTKTQGQARQHSRVALSIRQVRKN
jgi:hypothetical protein